MHARPSLVDVVSMFVVTLLATLALWVAIPVAFLGWSGYAMRSGSMAPAIHRGDVVLTSARPRGELEPGAIVVFDAGGDTTVAHRIVGLRDGSYITRGDGNATADSDTVSPDDIRGVGRLVVPFAALPYIWWQEERLLYVLAVGLGCLGATCLIRRRRGAYA